MSKIDIKNLVKYFGTQKILHGIDISISKGEFCVLVGPSGCGKSTTLRMVAGLETISGGEIIIGDRIVNGLKPRERGIAMVFQNYALYPAKTVYNNMAFSLQLSRINKNIIDQKVREVAKILDISDLLDRKPATLSGGQRQRVAMGRAIVRDPEVFLFDEPLSNLDAQLRGQMRAEIKLLHQRLKNTVIYVTHDQVEAMTLADKIVVINEGEIIQVGSPRELFNKPKNLFVAEFIGTPKMNVLNCITKKGFIYLNGKKDIKTNIKKSNVKINKIGFRPNKVIICEKEKGLFTGEIKFIEYLGSEQFIYVDCGIDEKLVVVKTTPDYKISIKVIIGLKILSKDLYFFAKNGEVLF